MALSGASRSPLGAGRRVTMASSTSGMPRPVLAEISMASEASMPITSSICSATLFGLGGGQVDLVEDRHDLVIRVDGLVDIGERLRLDPWEASTTSSEPSTARIERLTS
jgi:hypothetical protein